ncbi:hypothetical protein [Sphingopyxis macrogoltabida]|uniref:hypothetical protein n=1 Tax=Sphingopyxis macrogoltabida TaxID=33050 RepID=UPI001F47D5DF|nr:hypothetical protein [Sphingopyxis macrogoltabida]
MTKLMMRGATRPLLALLMAGVSAPALAQEAATEVAVAETTDGTDIVVTRRSGPSACRTCRSRSARSAVTRSKNSG